MREKTDNSQLIDGLANFSFRGFMKVTSGSLVGCAAGMVSEGDTQSQTNWLEHNRSPLEDRLYRGIHNYCSFSPRYSNVSHSSVFF